MAEMTKRTRRGAAQERKALVQAGQLKGAPRYDDEAKLHNAAGQVYETERMDRLSDDDIDALQIDEMILNEGGERKGRHRRG